MNTYDDVRAFGVDRYNGMIRDAEQERLVQATQAAAPAGLRPAPVRPSVRTVMLRLIRDIVGKVAHLGARP